MISSVVGRSGFRTSHIVYGNAVTHGNQIDDLTAKTCVLTALDAGITTFDTADVYADGHGEEILGNALADVPRDSYQLATKVYWPTGPGPDDRGLGRKHVINGCHDSLRRLRTDHIDLYQAHRYDSKVPLEESIQAFADLIHDGKVRYFGVSEWSAAQIQAGHELARQAGISLVSNQPQYSMLWRTIETEVVPTCERLGVGQIAFAAMAQGVLTGKYAPDASFPDQSRAGSTKLGFEFISRWLTSEVLTAVQGLRSIALEADVSLPQMALAWVLQRPGVSAVIVGASSPDQIQENAKASGIRLDGDVIRAIDDTLSDVIHPKTSRPQGASNEGD